MPQTQTGKGVQNSVRESKLSGARQCLLHVHDYFSSRHEWAKVWLNFQSESHNEVHAKSIVSDLVDTNQVSCEDSAPVFNSEITEIEFSIPKIDSSHPVLQRMSKMPKQSKKSKVRFSYDGDNMKTIMKFGSTQNSKAYVDGCCGEQYFPIPVAEKQTSNSDKTQSEVQPNSDSQVIADPMSQIGNAWMATRMMANMRKGNRIEVMDPGNGETHCCLDQSCERCCSDNAKGRVITKEELEEFYAEQAKWKQDHLNLITAVDHSVLNFDDQDMVWIQVSCAVDSGSCANDSPAGIF